VLKSRILTTRNNRHASRTPYDLSMLQHAGVVALLLLTTTIAACTSDTPAHRYTAEIFDEVTVEPSIVYRSDPDLRLDLYRPTDDDDPRRPGLVWVHGGGFAGGDRTSAVIPFARAFAKSGYVVASIDYRLTATSPCVGASHLSDECRRAVDAAVEDAQAAVRWLKRNASAYGVDGDRIAIAGESAGGITAAGVGTRADDAASAVRAWVSISGGIDGGAFVDAHDAPALLFAGTADPYIPYQWSVDALTALRQTGVRATLVTLDGAGHVPAEYADRFVRESRDFLYDALDLR